SSRKLISPRQNETASSTPNGTKPTDDRKQPKQTQPVGPMTRKRRAASGRDNTRNSGKSQGRRKAQGPNRNQEAEKNHGGKGNEAGRQHGRKEHEKKGVQKEHDDNQDGQENQ
ncbi:unnamed protein product, partial [Allacma fusca]